MNKVPWESQKTVVITFSAACVTFFLFWSTFHCLPSHVLMFCLRSRMMVSGFITCVQAILKSLSLVYFQKNFWPTLSVAACEHHSAQTLQKESLNQIISENKPYDLCLCTSTLLNFKRKIWTWTGTWIRTSRSLARRSTIELSWFSCQFTFKLSSWNNCHYLQG